MREKDISVGIIGAGPAGISAAVQLCRSDFPVTLFEGGKPGGLIRNAWRVENLPVCPVTSGPQVADQLVGRLVQSGADMVPTDADRVEYDPGQGHFVVHCRLGVYRFHTLVVASGTRPKPWPLLDEAETEVKSHLYRHVDGIGAGGGSWAVIGSGDAAFDYALSLHEKGRTVFLILRGEQAKALPLLQREVCARKDGITCLTRSICTELTPGQGKPVRMRMQTDGGLKILEVDGLVGAIGRIPSMDFLSESILMQSAELNRSGRFFMIGDVNGGRLRQAGIAVGQGLQAAMRIAGAKIHS